MTPPRVLFAALLCLPLTVPAAEWIETTIHGERAFASTSAGWRAVVSLERSRLLAFGPADRPEVNLLQAPPDENQSSFWGGHRLWLGPQSEWPEPWPPIADWENSAAEKIEAEAGILRLTHPRRERAYPQLHRTYRWEGATLHLGARWRPGPRHRFQAVHILQISGQAVVRVPRRDSPYSPLGYVHLAPGSGRTHIWNHPESPSVRREGEELVLFRSEKHQKVGFLPQPLRARIGDYELTLHPGRGEGEVGDAPEAGFVTQVYLGDTGFELIEIEQLSPRLGPGADGWAGFEVALEARRL